MLEDSKSEMTHTHTHTKKKTVKPIKIGHSLNFLKEFWQGVLENDLAGPTTARCNHWYVNRIFSSGCGIYLRAPYYSIISPHGKAGRKQRTVARICRKPCTIGWFQSQQKRTRFPNWWQSSCSSDYGWPQREIICIEKGVNPLNPWFNLDKLTDRQVSGYQRSPMHWDHQPLGIGFRMEDHPMDRSCPGEHKTHNRLVRDMNGISWIRFQVKGHTYSPQNIRSSPIKHFKLNNPMIKNKDNTKQKGRSLKPSRGAVLTFLPQNCIH